MCASGPQVELMGCMAPIEKDAVLILAAEWKPFLIGKDGLVGEAVWDQMYRSNRQSRDGIFVMAISAADNALWDIRGRYLGGSRIQAAGRTSARVGRDVCELPGLSSRSRRRCASKH
jgi:L-alanine-DL-glutamate epimerase-like enolase superfamily enzyme